MRTTERIYTEVHAVIQKNPCGTNWYAGCGAVGTEGKGIFSIGCYLETMHLTKAEAKQAAFEHARAYRNTILTLGGCTFETLPPVVFKRVGQ